MSINFSCIVNVSEDSLTDSAWIVSIANDIQSEWNGYSSASFSLLLFLLGTPWNLYVILATTYKKLLFMSPILILMFNLALTNLLICIFVLPFAIISGFSQEYIFGSTDEVRCRVCSLGFTSVALPFNALLTLTLMSVERFLYLKKPLKYQKIVTIRNTLIAIFVAWVISILVSLPPFFGFGSINFSYVVVSCVPLLVGSSHLLPNYYYTVLISCVGFIFFIIIMVTYVWILVIARKNLLRREKHLTRFSSENISSVDSRNSNNVSRSHKPQQLQMIRLFLLLFLANIVTWIPLLVAAILGAAIGPFRIPAVVYSMSWYSFIVGIVIHPILQSALIYELRVLFMKNASNLGKLIKRIMKREQV